MAACSPSSGLPSRHAERNAVLDGELDHPDGCRAAWSQEVEEPVQHRADAHLPELAAWDAWVGVRRDATADAEHPELHLPSADGAEKSVGRELDAQVRDAERWRWELRAAPAAALAAGEPCTPGAVRSAERSCAALEVAERPDEMRSKALQGGAHSPKSQAVQPRTESGPVSEVSDVPTDWLAALAPKTELTQMPQAERPH